MTARDGVPLGVRLTGEIVSLVAARGFGFVRVGVGVGSDVFFHASDVRGAAQAFSRLQDGDRVELEVGPGRGGRRAGCPDARAQRRAGVSMERTAGRRPARPA